MQGAGFACPTCGASLAAGAMQCAACGQTFTAPVGSETPGGPPQGPPQAPPQGPPGAPTGAAGPPGLAGPTGPPGAGAAGGPPPSMPVATAPAASAAPRPSGAMVPLAIALAGLVVAAAAVVFTTKQGSDTTAAGGEIFLEPAAAVGANPFTQALDPVPTTTTTSKPAPTTSKAGGAGGSTPPATVAPVDQPTSGVVPPPGSPPYGGTGDDAVCDKEKLVAFLGASPAQAKAWAGVLGVAVDQIPTYVRSLTPAQLLYDTRVTNHGFVNGVATPLQSVLQAGTAVLLDPKGNPVVRCRCGNPLLPPAPVSQPRTVGTPWPGYTGDSVVAVRDGATTNIPLGGGIVAPTTAPPSTTTPPTSAPTTSGPTTSGPTTSPPVTTSTPGPPTTTGIPKIDTLLAQLAACGTTSGMERRTDPDLPNISIVVVTLDGEALQFTYDASTDSLAPGSQITFEVMNTCGISR